MAYNPTYKIDLLSVFNKTYSSQSSEFRNNLRPIISNPSFKKVFGQAVVERIIGRTEVKNIDKEGAAFKSYSKSYRDSDIFKLYGKSKYQVNLKLTGEMLASLRSKNISDGVEIGLDGNNNRAKAHGHIYKGGKMPKRDFLGLPQKDLNEIMKASVRAFKDEFSDSVDWSISLKGQVGQQSVKLDANLIDILGADIGEI